MEQQQQSSMEVLGSLTLNPDENFVMMSLMDPAGDFGYFGTSTEPGGIVKVALSSFSRVGGLTLEKEEDYPSVGILDENGGIGYFGVATQTKGPYGSYQGSIVKVRLRDFVRVESLKLNPDLGEVAQG